MPFKPRPIRPADRKNDLQKIFSVHIADGTIDAGIEYFRSIVVQNPNHSLAWLLLGRLRESCSWFASCSSAIPLGGGCPLRANRAVRNQPSS
jgi:hypothetical protein